MKLNDSRLFRQQCFIDGRWVDADSGETMEVLNPANGETIGTMPNAGAEETRRAIEAADAAWPAWRKHTAKERATVIRAWHDLILANADDLAMLMTLEQGKPLAEAKGEIVYASSFVEWFAEEGKRAYGEVIPQTIADRRIVVIKEPVGVVAAITPWNFPAAMITRKAGPALAAGCPIVLKPASATPYTATALVELADRAGVPKGIINLLSGSARAIGGEMTENPTVRKLSFTGSTQIGKELMAQCAGTIKKISLELGGNAPLIVFDDCDMEQAVRGAMASKYRNAGQTCVCANRILVQDGVYDEFASLFAEAVGELQVGHGLSEGVTQGPLIDMAAVEKVEEHIQDAIDKGARLVVGGGRHSLGGQFFRPTVLAEATQDMKISGEETFGPVAPLFRFDTEKEAIDMANNTEFGLAAYFFSRDIGRIWRVSEALEYGMVGVNEGIISTEVAPFGGYKESGLGREGGREGLSEYLETKYLCMGGI
ncbi:MAG: NAD-dependent succinate-semialdehyde dehydrogenase [Alphaproteobacteria bacterium]|nr:NAD-dependent succinate-semialdehyde dehydrogenase [Alphaproteobacteria bacterium]HIB55698.1 NAD-dependent succinate-semialdehyde dehydrogenase [Alphaproteobacteria bacterium]